MPIEKVKGLSDEEIDKLNEAIYELNSIGRKLIYIRLGLPVKNGFNIQEKLDKVKSLLKDVSVID